MHFPTLIDDQEGLQRLCEILARAKRVAVDTEFIPERVFVPELCLIQIAVEDVVTVVDPLAFTTLEPLWTALIGLDWVVHAGKEEMRFCQQFAGALPKSVFDVQLAAGMVGLGHPLSLTNLVRKVLELTPKSGETRTNWKKRPLTSGQLEYALDDVRFLFRIQDDMVTRLERLDRQDWFTAETANHLQMYNPEERRGSVRKLPGAGSLSSRQLAVLNAVSRWREERARTLNKPARWILRDDLIVELAKRQPTSRDDLRDTRGLGSIGDGPWVERLVQAIAEAKQTPESDLPTSNRRREAPDEGMVTKVLSAAISQIARSADIAAGILCNNADILEFLDWHAQGAPSDRPPRLASGWRGELCGQPLTDIIEGRIQMRIQGKPGDLQLHFDGALKTNRRKKLSG